MRFGSLFAGIGGFDLGLERAGMECAWQVENDPFCRKILGKHWPNVQRFNDVKECGRHNLEQVDLIVGGFPCQDISFAGLGAGIDGERSGLWREFYRIICELRPRYIIVENVSALLNRGMGRVLGDLAAGGYDAEWRVFQAHEFGFNHRRKRIFIVAYPNGQGGAGLEQGRSPRIFGSRRWGSETNMQIEDWRTRPLLDSGTESLLCRKADGVPDRIHRLKTLGNAVIPDIAKGIGRRVLDHALQRTITPLNPA